MILGVETGGTKIVARIVGDRGETIAEGRWPTTTPPAAAAAIVELVGDQPMRAAAIAAFGPLIVDPAAADRGRVLETTKPGWTGSNLRADLADRLGCPVAVDTDVNAAARAEQALGAGRGCSSVGYVTVGTGIGGGLAVDGRTLTGALHPEIGHLRLIRAPGDTMPSVCPFHADCTEGLASGPAVEARLAVATRGEVTAIVAHYLGQLLVTLVLTWSPHRIVLGGGVMKTPGLIERVTIGMHEAFGGYGVGSAVAGDSYLMPAALDDAGLEGALLMARAIGPVE